MNTLKVFSRVVLLKNRHFLFVVFLIKDKLLMQLNLIRVIDAVSVFSTFKNHLYWKYSLRKGNRKKRRKISYEHN